MSTTIINTPAARLDTLADELDATEREIRRLQQHAQLLRAQAATDTVYSEWLEQVDPHRDAHRRHAQLVGANLRDLRHAAGFSQQQLGLIIDTDRKGLTRWERGHSMPSPRWQERLAAVLEVHWTCLYKRRDD